MPTSARLEVANSPQITVKNGAICRVDVGIGPYKKIIGVLANTDDFGARDET